MNIQDATKGSSQPKSAIGQTSFCEVPGEGFKKKKKTRILDGLLLPISSEIRVSLVVNFKLFGGRMLEGNLCSSRYAYK